MKKYLCFIAFLLTSSISFAKHTRKGEIDLVECIYTNVVADMQVEAIQLTDSSTIIFMKAHGVPGEKLYVRSSIYLEDLEQNRYFIKSSNGVTLDQGTSFPLNSTLEFSLVFGPFEGKEAIFDLLYPLAQSRRSFGFWGIHAKGLKYKAKKINDDYRLYDKNGTVKQGMATVRGKFNHLPSTNSVDSVKINYFALDGSNATSQNRKAGWVHVDETGSFETKLQVDGVAWAYLQTPHTSIPVMLYPDDTTMMDIDCSQYPICQTLYTSANGNDIYQHLMEADPIMFSPVYLKESWSECAILDDLVKMTTEARQDLHPFLSYIAYKYNLSQAEYHLMRLYLNTDIEYYHTMRLDRTVQNAGNAIIVKKADEVEVTNVDMDEVRRYLPFVSDIDLRDYSYCILPERKMHMLISNLPYVSTVFSLGGTRSLDSILREYFGEMLDSHWSAAIKYYNPM